VGNLFLYYLFCFATSLGDEIFYISFFPFWFWNIDGYVGRRLCIFWGAFMYLGQATKDILKIPRPTSPPVVKLEKRYSLEYGMPSTHAMVGAGLPFGIYFLTRDRYLFPSMVTLSGAIIWCSVVCLSRIYMGMHTLLDIVGGLLYVFSLMFVCFYFSILDKVDYFVLHASLPSLIVTCLLIPICLCLFYPLDRNTWSTSRGDTTIIIAVCSGSLISHWLNYNLGQMN
ncbi:hypothetical protein HELRODRAFT_122845, partial [Helobdella robusta]|uniref:Phosphatidic acid phosphatase type 2/haloperoxidase domain-containing protein n=1 Tax=Helobdella robusta TaxID=6412 RepID=T1EGW1_HELRO